MGRPDRKLILTSWVRNEGDLGQSVSRRQGEKWSDSGHIMKIEGIGFADRLGVHARREKLRISPRIWPEQQGRNCH